MEWRDECERELRIAEQAMRAGQSGKARTCARRAVACASAAMEMGSGSARQRDAMQHLASITERGDAPEAVKQAAERLRTRLDANFQSPSVDPVNDAHTIIQWIQTMIGC